MPYWPLPLLLLCSGMHTETHTCMYSHIYTHTHWVLMCKKQICVWSVETVDCKGQVGLWVKMQVDLVSWFLPLDVGTQHWQRWRCHGDGLLALLCCLIGAWLQDRKTMPGNEDKIDPFCSDTPPETAIHDTHTHTTKTMCDIIINRLNRRCWLGLVCHYNSVNNTSAVNAGACL